MDGYDGIFGTTCIDVAPQGELGEYFNFDDTNAQKDDKFSVEKDNFFVIMNPDMEVWEQANMFKQAFGFRKYLNSDSATSIAVEKAIEYEVWKIKQIYGV